MSGPIPISTLFISLHSLLAIVLAYIVADERAKARIWHGEAERDIANQANPLEHPSPWAQFIEHLTQRIAPDAAPNPALLHRKIRAHSNFSEYVPQGLLLLMVLELTDAPAKLVWSLSLSFLIARLAHAYGVIVKYGPSIGRAVGFLGTLLVFLVGSLACLYYNWV